MQSRSPRGSDAGGRKTGVARALSKLGYCSRTEGFALVREGKVRVNGSTVKNPETPVRVGKDRIEVLGKKISSAEKQYWMLNKPRGIVTTARDEKSRKTVYEFLPQNLPWLAPVGRLDQASEGLLLFTNDAQWAERITNPESHLEKIYHVQINSLANDDLLQKLKTGVLDDGELLSAASVRILRSGEKNCWLELTLTEGKNRQIRRMLDAVGVEVLQLVRVSIGSLQLGDLKKGSARKLTREEKSALDAAMRAGNSYVKT